MNSASRKTTGRAVGWRQGFCLRPCASILDDHEEQLPPGGTNSLVLSQRPVYYKGEGATRWLGYSRASYLGQPAPDTLGESVEGYVLEHPAHGKVRNFLYFDLHVGSKRASGWADY